MKAEMSTFDGIALLLMAWLACVVGGRLLLWAAIDADPLNIGWDLLEREARRRENEHHFSDGGGI
jgi:hypothetical protein